MYLNSRGKLLNIRLVQNIAEWVGKMLRMFGLSEGERTELGWGQVESSEGNSNVRHGFCQDRRLLKNPPSVKKL